MNNYPQEINQTPIGGSIPWNYCQKCRESLFLNQRDRPGDFLFSQRESWVISNYSVHHQNYGLIVVSTILYFIAEYREILLSFLSRKVQNHHCLAYLIDHQGVIRLLICGHLFRTSFHRQKT